MALKITQQNGTFLVEGVINATTALSFKNHLNYILDKRKELIIDIENVTEIDTNGVNALQTLYTNAMIYNKSFFVVGTGCKEIQEHFESNNAA